MRTYDAGTGGIAIRNAKLDEVHGRVENRLERGARGKTRKV
jgi:hypothetical protein